MDNIESLKREFLHREFCSSCFMAGFGMARNLPPVYKENADREAIKNFLRERLHSLQGAYNQKEKVDSDRHTENVEKIRKELSEKYSGHLTGGMVSFGRMQKIVNLYLKYLWVSNIIRIEPPHCPIDSIIIAKLGKQFQGIAFTQMAQERYKKVIDQCNLVAKSAGFDSIAQWELKIFNNR